MAVNPRTKVGAGWLQPLEPIQKSGGKIPESLIYVIYNTLQGLISAYNGNISMGDGSNGGWGGNLDVQEIEMISPATPDTSFDVPHGLNRLAVGYDITRRNKAGTIYDDGPGDWGLDVVKLKCNVASMSFRVRLY